MLSLVSRRLLLLPLTVLGVSLVLFVLSYVAPADPVKLLLTDRVDPEILDNMRAAYGLDQPVYIQYGRYVWRLVQGDMGISFRYVVPVSDLLWSAFPATLTLVGASAIIAIVYTLTIGFVAGFFRNTWIDISARVFAIVGISVPIFYLGFVVILVFGFYLGWIPISGRGDPPDLWHLIAPAFVLALPDAAAGSRILRANLLDTLQEDYVRAARARGIDEGTILTRHVARNALIPTMTDLGVSLASIGGSVILVETVFAWPGIGRLVHIGITYNDFPLVIGSVILLLSYAILITLAVDIMYRLVDPRMRSS